MYTCTMLHDQHTHPSVYGVVTPARLTVGQRTRKTRTGAMISAATIQFIKATRRPFDFVKKIMRAPTITPAPPAGMAGTESNT